MRIILVGGYCFRHYSYTYASTVHTRQNWYTAFTVYVVHTHILSSIHVYTDRPTDLMNIL